jgi:hypothetical protein
VVYSLNTCCLPEILKHCFRCWVHIRAKKNHRQWIMLMVLEQYLCILKIELKQRIGRAGRFALYHKVQVCVSRCPHESSFTDIPTCSGWSVLYLYKCISFKSFCIRNETVNHSTVFCHPFVKYIESEIVLSSLIFKKYILFHFFPKYQNLNLGPPTS